MVFLGYNMWWTGSFRDVILPGPGPILACIGDARAGGVDRAGGVHIR